MSRDRNQNHGNRRGAVALMILCALCWLPLWGGCGKQGEMVSLEQVLTQQTAGAQRAVQNGREEIPDGQESGTGAKEKSKQAVTGATATVWVHICGEVEMPGLYELAEGSRIYDALMAAGGFTAQADTGYLNLAQKVTDGMQIVVGGLERTGAVEQTGGLININTASSEELQTLPGIGESRARDIIAYREQCGGFTSPEQIMLVSGIKSAVYEKIKDLITTGR